MAELATDGAPAGEMSIDAALDAAFDGSAAEGSDTPAETSFSDDDDNEDLSAAFSQRQEDGQDDDGNVPKDESEKESDDKQISTSQTEESEPLDPPATWAKEYKERFKQLPRDLQEVVLDRERHRERHYTQKQEELARASQGFADIGKVLQPHMQRYQLHGVTPAQVIQQSLAVEAMLNQNPVEGLQWIAKRYGVDLSRPLVQPSYQPPQDPRYNQVQQELATLKQWQQQQQQQAMMQYTSSLQNEVDTFKAEHPYVDDLEAEMTPIVAGLKQANPTLPNRQILEKAYKLALDDNKDIKARVAAQQQAVKQRELESKAKRARVAGSSVYGAPNGAHTGRAPKSLDDMLDMAIDEYN